MKPGNELKEIVRAVEKIVEESTIARYQGNLDLDDAAVKLVDKLNDAAEIMHAFVINRPMIDARDMYKTCQELFDKTEIFCSSFHVEEPILFFLNELPFLDIYSYDVCKHISRSKNSEASRKIYDALLDRLEQYSRYADINTENEVLLKYPADTRDSVRYLRALDVILPTRFLESKPVDPDELYIPAAAIDDMRTCLRRMSFILEYGDYGIITEQFPSLEEHVSLNMPAAKELAGNNRLAFEELIKSLLQHDLSSLAVKLYECITPYDLDLMLHMFIEHDKSPKVEFNSKNSSYTLIRYCLMTNDRSTMDSIIPIADRALLDADLNALYARGASERFIKEAEQYLIPRLIDAHIPKSDVLDRLPFVPQHIIEKSRKYRAASISRDLGL